MACLTTSYFFFQHILMFLWDTPVIPSISYDKIINGQVRMVSLSQLQWRYWLTALCVGFMTYNQFFVLYIQRMLNLHREACYCDFTKALSRTTPIEALFLGYGSSDLSRQYLFCRETCP